jgi:hypothetical protein
VGTELNRKGNLFPPKISAAEMLRVAKKVFCLSQKILQIAAILSSERRGFYNYGVGAQVILAMSRLQHFKELLGI